jgi:hypothetical protein
MSRAALSLPVIAVAITAACSFSSAQATVAAHVDFATTGVNAVGPTGQVRSLAKGAEINTGETIDTGGGRVQLRFTDGGLVSLQPRTQFRMESYSYDRNNSGGNSLLMNLLKGGMRSITGLIGKTNRQGYRLQTATATVGIRGTEFSINGLPGGGFVFFVADGAIDVTNQAGSTILTGGTSATVTSANSAPTKVDDKPYLPPAGAVNTQITPPTNPVQDSQPSGIKLLTGTYGGSWATVTASYPNPYGSSGSSVFTVDASGKLVSFGDVVGIYGLGAATATSDGNDGVLAWGRWIGGPITLNGADDVTYPSHDPLHYIVGAPATGVPTTGTATYSMVGSTTPSCATTGAGCGGTITVASSVLVNFGTSSGNFNLSVTNANAADTVNVSTPAGGVPFSVFSGPNGVSFSSSVSSGLNITSSTSATGATLSATGFLAGAGGSEIGAVYNVGYAGTTVGTTSIGGAIAYKK